MKSIVIIDDHPAIRMAIRALLSQNAQLQVVHEAGSSQDALEFLRKNTVDLIILDIEMPRIDGFSLLKRIRDEQIDTKVLFLSAKDELVYASRAIEAGGNGFISKNEDMQEIYHAVKTILSGYSFFPNAAIAALHSAAPPLSTTKKIATLSDRELAVMRYLVRGHSNKHIAEQLFISNKTVSTYKTRILEKLSLSSVIELADFARENNVT